MLPRGSACAAARIVLWTLNRSVGHRGAARAQALKDAGCSEVVLAINYQPKVRMARMRPQELCACARWQQRSSVQLLLFVRNTSFDRCVPGCTGNLPQAWARSSQGVRR